MKRYIIPVLLTALLVAGCNKKFNMVTDPDISASVESSTVFVGEGVNFHFDGSADFITFYSGEEGNDYEFRDIDRTYDGVGYLSFSCGFQNGSQYMRQSEAESMDKMLSFWWSDDFDGNYTLESIEKATWHDLSNFFTWPSSRVVSDNARDLKTNEPCGEMPLDALIGKTTDKPVYFAFRYKCDPLNAEGTNGRSRAVVSAFRIRNICEEVNIREDLVSQTTANLWHLVTKGYENVVLTSQPEVNVSYIYFNCDAASDVEKICWAVTSPVTLDYTVNVGCDYGLGIKSFTNDNFTDYTYSYAEPGDYKVHLIYRNVGAAGDQREKQQEIDIKVIDTGTAGIDDPEIKIW